MIYSWRNIGGSFLVLLVLSIPFWLSDIDLQLQAYLYLPGNGGWYLHERGFWPLLYQYGVLPGLLMALLSLLAVAASYWRAEWVMWRKPALLLLFSLMLGPGLVINLILKDHFGRPRPREVIEFQGNESYQPLLIPGKGDGKSFPCGHGSIGFYLALPFLFLRKRHLGWALAWLGVGILSGSVLTAARMMAGGHFLSDGLWAAGLVWICGLLVARWIKLDEPVVQSFSKNKARQMSILMGVLLPIVSVGLLLATPYISSKSFVLSPEKIDQLPRERIRILLKEADVKVRSGDSLSVIYQANCFGFPTSKIRPKWNEESLTYELRSTGWFTEVNIQAEIVLPVSRECQLQLNEGYITAESLNPNHHLIMGNDVRLTNGN